VDVRQLGIHRSAVGAGGRRLEFLQLLQARDADLEELIQIVRRNAQETQPFQQRKRGIPRLGQHTVIELEQ